jgi:hypothetical protein
MLDNAQKRETNSSPSIATGVSIFYSVAFRSNALVNDSRNHDRTRLQGEMGVWVEQGGFPRSMLRRAEG